MTASFAPVSGTMPARPRAVVTGASSGIGAALAHRLADAGCDLVLVARDRARLDAEAVEVAARGAGVEVLVADLSDPAQLRALADRLRASPPDILVNNAGFGASGRFADLDPERSAAMIATNVTALTLLTAAVLPGMRARGSGRILNVASTGAFAPLPFSAVYGATKAYVLSFSESVAEEMAGSGVTVTALCPGPTPTRFFARSGMDGTRLFKGPMTSAGQVAEAGCAAMMAGRRVVVVGMVNRLLVLAARLVPRRLVRAATRHMLAPRPRPTHQPGGGQS